MDRSSIIASREGGSSMIQQLPHVLGAKAYYAVDLKYILKKAIETLYCKSATKSTLLKAQQLYSASIISYSSIIGLTYGNNKIWRRYRDHWRTPTTSFKGQP